MLLFQRNRKYYRVTYSRFATKTLSLVLCVYYVLPFVAGTAAQHAPAKMGSGTLVLDNEWIAVWDVTLMSGKPVSMDHQDDDSITLYFTDSKIRTTYADGKTLVDSRKFGDAAYGPKGTVEKREVISGSPARFFVINFKALPVRRWENTSGLPLAYPRPGSTKVFENDRVVVWKYTFPLGVRTRMHYHDKDALVVYRYDGSIRSTTPDGKSIVSDNKAGQIKFNEGDRAHYEELVKGQESVIVAELK